jgi:hypothetical protein
VKQFQYVNRKYELVDTHEGGNFDESMEKYKELKSQYPTHRFELHGKDTEFRAEIIAGQLWSI